MYSPPLGAFNAFDDTPLLAAGSFIPGVTGTDSGIGQPGEKVVMISPENHICRLKQTVGPGRVTGPVFISGILSPSERSLRCEK